MLTFLKKIIIFLCVAVLTACGGGGGGSSEPTPPPTPPASVSISANPLSVLVGNPTTLTWSTSNATSCNASGSWSGSKSTSGTEDVTIQSVGDNQFTLTCSGSGGSGSDSVTVEGYQNTSGFVVDGYISGAEVFLDLNENLLADDDEPQTTSTDLGGFELRDAPGNLISIGGVDYDTQNDLTGLLLWHKSSSSEEGKTITPITSVASFYDNPGIINEILGLDSSIDVFFTDPVANMRDGGIFDTLYEKGNQLTAIALTLQGVINDVNSTSNTTEGVFQSISEVLKTEFDSTGDAVNIETSAFIEAVIEAIESKGVISLNDNNAQNLAMALSAVLPLMQVKNSDAVTFGIFDFALSTLVIDAKEIAAGTIDTEKLEKYQNAVLDYISEDKGLSQDDLIPELIAVNDNVLIFEDNTKLINVLGNDSFVAGADISVSVSAGTNSTVEVQNNKINFVPSENFYGQEELDYTISQDVYGLTTSSAKIFVTVDPVNDAPVFSSATTFEIPENQTEVATLKASDVENQTITFSLDGEDVDALVVNADSGELSFVNAPDYEEKTSYSVIAIASDGTNDTNQNISIAITNINDVAPVISSSAVFEIDENQTDVGRVVASDVEEDALTFSITGSDLSISNDGNLAFVIAPDYEDQINYNETITVSDGINTATQDITINVNNLNDNSPVFTSSATFNADENQSAIGSVTATDADGNSIQYSVNSDVFTIDAQTGELAFVEAPDYETKSDYIVVVSATDEVYTTEQTVNVVINNLNDNSPIITSSATFNADENQTAVGNVLISDADGVTGFTCTVTGDNLLISNSDTVADPTTEPLACTLSFEAAPDYETKNSYSGTVTVTDGEYAATQEVTVNVVNKIEINADTNPTTNEMVKTFSYSIEDTGGGSELNLEVVRDVGVDFTPTQTIGNQDINIAYALTTALVIEDGEIYQALSDIQIGNGGSLTIKPGGKLIGRFVDANGVYQRPNCQGTTITNTYGENHVLVSCDGGNGFEEANSVFSQNILVFDDGEFKVEGTADNMAEIRNISVAFAVNETLNQNRLIDINYVNWRGGSLHPFFFRRTENQAFDFNGSLLLKNSYLKFVNSVNLMRLDRRFKSGDIIIEDNVFHNSGGFSLDFRFDTSGLLRVQRNIFFGEEVYRVNKPAFLSFGITGGTQQNYELHTDGKTKVLFQDNAFITNSSETKAITCENYDPYIPWGSNYFGFRSDIDTNLRQVITDANNDLSKSCNYDDSFVLLDPPRTWKIEPYFYFATLNSTGESVMTTDIPIDYESTSPSDLPFIVQASNDIGETKVIDMTLSIIDVDEPAQPLLANLGAEISVDEGEIDVKEFFAQYANDDTISLEITGDDASLFEIENTSGKNYKLKFKTAQDYENPGDANGDRTYKITITLSNGELSDVQDIDVLLQNVGEEADAPVVSELTFSPQEVNVESSDQIVVVNFRVTDFGGLKQMQLYVEDRFELGKDTLPRVLGVGCYENCTTGEIERISGDKTDGNYRVELTIPQGTNNNEDYFIQIYAQDENNVQGSYASGRFSADTQNLATASGEDEFLVVVGGNSDFSGPVVSELTFSPQEVNVESSDQIVVVNFKITDETGLNQMQLYVEDRFESGKDTLPRVLGVGCSENCTTGEIERISGDKTDGNYRVELTIPQGTNNNEDYFIQIYAQDENKIQGSYVSGRFSDTQNLATASGEDEFLVVVGGGEEADLASFAQQIPQLINIGTFKITPSINLD